MTPYAEQTVLRKRVVYQEIRGANGPELRDDTQTVRNVEYPEEKDPDLHGQYACTAAKCLRQEHGHGSKYHRQHKRQTDKDEDPLTDRKIPGRTLDHHKERRIPYDTVGDLQKHRQQISGKKESVQETLAQTDAKIKAINEQIHFTGQYFATRQIQKDFLRARFKKKYREEHRTEQDQYQQALSFFREHCDRKVPSMKQLKTEKEKLLTLQNEQRKELSGFDQMERELQTAAANVDAILHLDTVSEKRHSRHQPGIE